MAEHKNRFMAANRAGVAAVVLATLIPAMPVAADCLDWDDAGVQIVDGVVHAVPRVGDVSYRIAHVYAGFNHHAGAVEVRWTDAGTAMRQLLFHGMHDRPPVALARTTDGLAVGVQYCEHGAESCRTQTATYVYDPASRSFRAADATARAFLSTGCGT